MAVWTTIGLLGGAAFGAWLFDSISIGMIFWISFGILFYFGLGRKR